MRYSINFLLRRPVSWLIWCEFFVYYFFFCCYHIFSEQLIWNIRRKLVPTNSSDLCIRITSSVVSKVYSMALVIALLVVHSLDFHSQKVMYSRVMKIKIMKTLARNRKAVYRFCDSARSMMEVVDNFKVSFVCGTCHPSTIQVERPDLTFNLFYVKDSKWATSNKSDSFDVKQVKIDRVVRSLGWP